MKSINDLGKCRCHHVTIVRPCNCAVDSNYVTLIETAQKETVMQISLNPEIYEITFFFVVSCIIQKLYKAHTKCAQGNKKFLKVNLKLLKFLLLEHNSACILGGDPCGSVCSQTFTCQCMYQLMHITSTLRKWCCSIPVQSLSYPADQLVPLE